MAKESLTLFNNVAPNGLTVVSDVDVNAYNSGVFYFVLSNKPAGNVTYNLYVHEPISNTFTSVAGNILTANGSYRTEIPAIYDRFAHLEFSMPGTGGTVVAVLTVDDGA